MFCELCPTILVPTYVVVLQLGDDFFQLVVTCSFSRPSPCRDELSIKLTDQEGDRSSVTVRRVPRPPTAPSLSIYGPQCA